MSTVVVVLGGAGAADGCHAAEVPGLEPGDTAVPTELVDSAMSPVPEHLQKLRHA